MKLTGKKDMLIIGGALLLCAVAWVSRHKANASFIAVGLLAAAKQYLVLMLPLFLLLDFGISYLSLPTICINFGFFIAYRVSLDMSETVVSLLISSPSFFKGSPCGLT